MLFNLCKKTFAGNDNINDILFDFLHHFILAYCNNILIAYKTLSNLHLYIKYILKH